jgi:hypothetical protein
MLRLARSVNGGAREPLIAAGVLWRSAAAGALVAWMALTLSSGTSTFALYYFEDGRRRGLEPLLPHRHHAVPGGVFGRASSSPSSGRAPGTA